MTDVNTKEKKNVESTKDAKRWYNFIYSLIVPITRFFYPLSFKGRENIPEGLLKYLDFRS